MQSEQEEKREREWWVAEFGARGGIGCNKKDGLQEAMTPCQPITTPVQAVRIIEYVLYPGFPSFQA